MIRYSRLTSRGVQALVGLTEMRAMQTDVLAEFLGVGVAQTYRLAGQLADANAAERLPSVRGEPTWIVPTRAAATWVLGWRPGEWRPRSNSAVHCRAVARTRVALGACATDQWVSDRVLRHELPGPGLYPYDGMLLRAAMTPVAVKVDTSARVTGAQLSRRLNLVVRQARQDECAEILYVCDGSLSTDDVATAARQTLPDIPDLVLRITRLDALVSGKPSHLRPVDRSCDSLRQRATGGAH